MNFWYQSGKPRGRKNVRLQEILSFSLKLDPSSSSFHSSPSLILSYLAIAISLCSLFTDSFFFTYMKANFEISIRYCHHYFSLFHSYSRADNLERRGWKKRNLRVNKSFTFPDSLLSSTYFNSLLIKWGSNRKLMKKKQKRQMLHQRT